MDLLVGSKHAAQELFPFRNCAKHFDPNKTTLINKPTDCTFSTWWKRWMINVVLLIFMLLYLGPYFLDPTFSGWSILKDTRCLKAPAIIDSPFFYLGRVSDNSFMSNLLHSHNARIPLFFNWHTSWVQTLAYVNFFAALNIWSPTQKGWGFY